MLSEVEAVGGRSEELVGCGTGNAYLLVLSCSDRFATFAMRA